MPAYAYLVVSVPTVCAVKFEIPGGNMASFETFQNLYNFANMTHKVLSITKKRILNQVLSSKFKPKID
jgi:hypothetical protein